MQLALGLSLQFVGCFFAASGLAFMKQSSELDGARPMVLRWRWWLGFLLLAVLATLVEGVVLTLLPLTIVAPFAGLTILLSTLLAASGWISERVTLGRGDGIGCALTIVGVGLVSFFGPKDEHAEASLTFDAVLGALGDAQFSSFIAATILSVGAWLSVVCVPALRPLRAAADAAHLSTVLSAYAAAVCGALSQTFLKCVSVAIAYSTQLHSRSSSSSSSSSSSPLSPDAFADDAWLRQVWLRPPIWSAVGGLAICAPLQLFLIDVCLASGAVTYAVPLYQALLVTLEITSAAIFFHELEHQPRDRLVGFALGVATATIGLVLLSRSAPPRTAPGGGGGLRACQ